MSAALAYPINDITRPDAANDNAGLHQTLNDRLLLESLFSSGSLIHIRKHTDNVRTDYIKGPTGTVARVTDVVVTYLHPDGCIYCETKIARLGSAQAGTKADGSIDWREQYTPFGEQLQSPAANDNLDGFTGHIKDKATGLNYMQARYYDPVIGRFLSIDPVTFMDTGDTGYFNRYSYTLNDPINLIDPNGESALAPAAPTVIAACGGPQAVGCAVVGTVVAVASCASSEACRAFVTLPTTAMVPPAAVPGDVQSDIAPTPSIDDLINEAIGPNVGPMPGETPADFTDRITRECRESCIDQAVGEVGSGGDEMPPIGGGMGDKIGQCTHKCVDDIIENVDDDDFD